MNRRIWQQGAGSVLISTTISSATNGARSKRQCKDGIAKREEPFCLQFPFASIRIVMQPKLLLCAYFGFAFFLSASGYMQYTCIKCGLP
jgi:hypothetical protein